MRIDVTLAQAMAIASELAVCLALSVLFGYLAGSYLDSLLGTGLIFTIVVSLIGMVAGFYAVVRLVQSTARRHNRQAGPKL